MYAAIVHERDGILNDIESMNQGGRGADFAYALKARVDDFLHKFFRVHVVLAMSQTTSSDDAAASRPECGFDIIDYMSDAYAQGNASPPPFNVFSEVYAEFYASFAAFLLESGEPEQAVTACSRALAYAPRHRRARQTLARLAHESGSLLDGDEGGGRR